MIPPLTPKLERIRSWLVAAGEGVTPAGGVSAAGETIPGLQVQHGVVVVLVLDRNGVIAVTAQLQMPPDLAATLKNLGTDAQEKMLIAVRSGMMDLPRLGWNVMPATASRIGDVQTIQMIELLKVGEDEVTGFNRLMDAIQEIASMTIKVGAILGGALRPGDTLPASQTPRQADQRSSNHDRAYG